MDALLHHIYQARDVAHIIAVAITDIARVETMHYDGRYVFLRCLTQNSASDKMVEQRIQAMRYNADAYRDGDYLCVLVHPVKRRSDAPAWVLNVVMFLLTFGATFVTGMAYSPSGMSVWAAGTFFSVSLLLILGSHEFGHYFLALYHRMKATLPYFIPAPLISPIGTLGAFIQMKTPIPNRVALFDVGIAGPLAGFVVALPLTILGMHISDLEPIHLDEMVGGFILGESLLFKGLSWLFSPPVPEGFDVALHPMTYAGWVGFLITALNLLPVGQLDGGHIIYAMFPRSHPKLARVVLAAMVIAGLTYFHGWLVWVFLIVFVIRVDHPPTRNDAMELGSFRMFLGYLAILIFILTFTFVPMRPIE